MDIDSQLKDAQAQLEAKLKSRESVAKKRELERTLRKLSDEDVIAELEDKHGIDRIRILDTDKGSIVVGAPGNGEYKRIADKAGDINLTLATTYAKSTVLHPPKEELDKIMNESPALAWVIMRAANSIAAADAEIREGK